MDSGLGLAHKQVGLSVWMNLWLSHLVRFIQPVVSIQNIQHPLY